MINLSQSQILSNGFAKYFSAKGPKILTGFVSDISNLPDDQKLECFHVMSAVVNRDAMIPQTSLPVMTVCAPYITLVNLEVDHPEGLSEKRKAAGEAGAKARWNQDGKDGKPCDSDGKNGKNSKNGKSHESHEKHEITCDDSDTYGKIILPSEHDETPSYKNKDKRDKTISKEKSETDASSYLSQFQPYSYSLPMSGETMPMDVTWETHNDATVEEALDVIPCPNTYPYWAPIGLAVARAATWESFRRWSLKGDHFDERQNLRFYVAARNSERGRRCISEKLIFNVYRHGAKVIRPFGASMIAVLERDLAAVSDAAMETAAETDRDAFSDETPYDATPSAFQEPPPPFTMGMDALSLVPEKDVIRPSVEPSPLPSLSGKRFFNSTYDYVTLERGVSEETSRQHGLSVSGNYLHIPVRDWKGSPVVYTDKDGKRCAYEVIRNLSLQPQEKGCRYIVPTGVQKRPYNIEDFFSGSPVVFMTEGEIDALSVMDVGGKCVADHDGEAFAEYDAHKKEATVKMIVILADDDETGHRKAASKYGECIKRGIEAKILMMPKGCNDANDFLRMDRDAFAKTILDLMLGENASRSSV